VFFPSEWEETFVDGWIVRVRSHLRVVLSSLLLLSRRYSRLLPVSNVIVVVRSGVAPISV